MNEYKIFVSSEELASPLKKGLDNLKNDDSVIGKDSSIKVDGITIEEADVVVLLRDAEADILSRAQTNSKPVLLCDIDCSKFEKPNSAAIPFTWGLFSKNNKDKEKTFLNHYNLSFVYDDAEDIMDYIASLVFHMLEEFSYHSKYNKDIGYKKQAEFIHEFTQFYLDKMKQLVAAEGFVREDIKGDFYHIIYRYRPTDSNKPFHSIDGRDYDFVIEYHRGKPSEGIYYGIKGEVTSGDLEEQCGKFRKEWPNIFMMDKSDLQKIYDEICNESHDESRGKDIFWGYNFQLELTEILNNTFPWKDYLKCYKPTDNIWKNRYWLFWVTLNDDEDIVKVAARAVKLMAKTYDRCMNVNHDKYKKPNAKKNDSKAPMLQMTSFTIEAFKELEKKILKGTKGENINDFIMKLQACELIEDEERYECCYILTGEQDIASFAQKVESIIMEDFAMSRVPWGAIDRVFLPHTLNPSKDEFKSDYANKKKREKEKKRGKKRKK